MNQVELVSEFKKLRHRSIFNRASDKEFNEICKKVKFTLALPGSFFNKDVSHGVLCICLKGKAKILQKSHPHAEVDEVIPGRSFELKTLINKDQEWSYRWMASTQITLALIPFDMFLSLQSVNGHYLTYLERVVNHKEIQRIKNDARLVGIDQENAIRLISKLKEFKLSDEKVSLKSGLCVVSKGRINSKLNFNEKTYDLKVHRFPEVFLIQKDIELESSAASFWYIDEVLVDAIGIDWQQLKIFDQLSTQIEEIKQTKNEQSNDHIDKKQKAQEPEEDDDFTLEDFPAEAHAPKAKKFIELQQHDQMDCGAACLTMITRYYGKYVTIGTYRSIVHVTREGASMLALKRGAEAVGFDSIGVISGTKYLNTLRQPFIALMEYHYIVVWKVNEDSIIVSDPAKGKYEISLEDFQKSFSRNILLLKPNSKLKDFPKSEKSWKKYLELLRPYRPNFIEITFASLIIFFLSLSPTAINQSLIDVILPGQDYKLNNVLGLLIALVGVLTLLTSLGRGRYLAGLSSNINTAFSSLFFKHILKLPSNYFATRNVGDLVNRMEELSKIKDFLTNQGFQILINLFSLCLYGLILFLYDYRLFLIFLFASLAIIFVFKPVMDKFKLASIKYFGASSKLLATLFEQFTNINTIRSMNSTASASWRWSNVQKDVLKEMAGIQRLTATIQTKIFLTQEVIKNLLLFTAILLFLQLELSLGQILAISALSGTIMVPLLSLLQNWDDINKTLISVEKVDEVLTSKIESDNNENFSIKLEGDIVFKDVWFRYGGDTSPYILKGVNLTIKEGQTVAFVGSSGCGKTTVAYMINRIYEPEKGEIFIGNVNIKDIPLSKLRTYASMILQNTVLFKGRISYNIALEENIDNNLVTNVANIAQVSEFVNQIPMGLSANLMSSDGVTLSGGQKQRIGIARALYKKPNVLILDEATSALDGHTESKIVEGLNNYTEEMTNIVIAHRFNTISHADMIFVFDDGSVHESGTHKELVDRQGLYYSMFRKQLNL